MYFVRFENVKLFFTTNVKEKTISGSQLLQAKSQTGKLLWKN
jgi:hypothetical protein